MARGGTRERIQQVARELFVAQGVQATSLQDIANELGITKPALYYHFASREELVRSIITPMVEDLEAFVTATEAAHEHDPRALLSGFFDLHLKHRDILLLAVREMTTLADLGLLDVSIGWRTRVGDCWSGGTLPWRASARPWWRSAVWPTARGRSSRCPSRRSALPPWTPPASRSASRKRDAPARAAAG